MDRRGLLQECLAGLSGKAAMKSSWWYFLVLGLCGLGAAIIPWVYNQSQILKRADLNRQRDLWQTQKPQDFQLRIQVREGDQIQQVLVKFKKGNLEACRVEGVFLDLEAAQPWTPLGLFQQLDAWVTRMERKPGDCVVSARFHPKLGLPVRMVFRSREEFRRVEYQIAFQLEEKGDGHSPTGKSTRPAGP